MAEPEPGGQVNHEWQARAPLRLRRAPQRLLLPRREVGCNTDLADEADADAGFFDPFRASTTISSATLVDR